MEVLFTIAFGICGLVELIRHGHFFQELNIRIQTSPTVSPLVKQLMGCGFCQAHWAAAICLWLWFLVPYGNYVVIFFACTRIANLINDVFKVFCLSPKKPKDKI